MKKPIKTEALRSWILLNDTLRDADEKLCEKLLKEEQQGRRRKRFLMRIHSRLNKARADRERNELVNKL